MATNKKITDLTAAGALTGAEPIEVVQGGINVQTTTQDVANLGGGGSVTSVSGTANRITSTGGATPAIDISATFEGLLGKIAQRIDQNNSATTSAQLAATISDETGTGALVFATSPTLAGTPTVPTAAQGTNTTQVANTAFVFAEAALKLDRNLTIKTKTASHTLDSGDLTDLNAGKDILFLMDVAAGHNFTIPTNASVDIDAGGHIYVMRTGLGQTTFVGAGPPSVTGSSGALLDPGANILMPVIQTANDVWYVQNGSGGSYTTWNPGFTGFSANPGSVDASYVVIGKFAHIRMSASNGTSNATTFTITSLPVAPRVGMNMIGLIMNNGATATGRIDITAGVTTLTLYATAAAGAWTASGNKNAYLNFIMEVQ